MGMFFGKVGGCFKPEAGPAGADGSSGGIGFANALALLDANTLPQSITQFGRHQSEREFVQFGINAYAEASA
jgi:hypothetical protein